MFNSVTLTYKGVDYVIEPDNVMRLIAKVEDVITISDLIDAKSRKTAPMAKICMAYGTALRYAGAKVKDEELYSSIFTGGLQVYSNAITGLLMMMIPPDDVIEKQDGEGEKKPMAGS